MLRQGTLAVPKSLLRSPPIWHAAQALLQSKGLSDFLSATVDTAHEAEDATRFRTSWRSTLPQYW